ncbi:MAG: AtpZ/AtpI family protein [Lentimicrobiaceae bacterium]|nr:AtpZ/AtpI family protein [Lentimicrobiaceae bacterium]
MKQKDSKNKRPLFYYAKYSSLALQMIIIIGIGCFAGIKLDKWLNINFPIFTVSLTLFAVAAAIYIGVKDLL